MDGDVFTISDVGIMLVYLAGNNIVFDAACRVAHDQALIQEKFLCGAFCDHLAARIREVRNQ